MKRAVFHPEASQEYLAAIEYHAALSAELGERFGSEIQRLVGEISRDPQSVPHKWGKDFAPLRPRRGGSATHACRITQALKCADVLFD